jgi:hypothetical protein
MILFSIKLFISMHYYRTQIELVLEQNKTVFVV